MYKEYDVAVVGGGTSGVIAAVQSAREGAKTLLIEKSEILGGTVINAMVDFPGLFHAWKKQIIRGIGWELVSKCVEEDGGEFPDFSVQSDDADHWKWQVRINAPLYALICDEAVIKSGTDLMLGTMLAAVHEDNDRKVLTICSKNGLEEVSCRVLIDCTGDATAVKLAGYPVIKENEQQPATYSCCITDSCLENIDFETLAKDYDREVQKGHLKYTDIGWDSEKMAPRFLETLGNNSNHISIKNVSADTVEGKTAYDLEGRASILRVYRFLKAHRGFENLHLTQLAPECGTRESVRIDGKVTITKDHFLSAHRYGDDVCYTYYPIDVHTSFGDGLQKIYLKKGNLPTIPRGALLPKGSHNFLVAGRTISSDREANSAIRVQATCMAVGQAAGALAILACQKNCDVEEIAMDDLYALLKKYNAIIPKE